MISKNLFFKLIKQDLKKRIWCPVLIFIVYFLLLEVNLLMTIEKMLKYPKRFEYDIVTYVKDYFFGVEASGMAAAVCVTAFVCAISGFAYLHSKAQIDTYHSLPVSRTQLFWARYVSGILLFLIPFAVHVLICAGIAMNKNAFAGETVFSILSYIGIELIIFILTYSVSILAVELTGNLIISILGTVILFSYSTIIAVLVQVLFDRFLYTYEQYCSRYGTFICEGVWCFSPLSMIYKLFTIPQEMLQQSSGEIFKYDTTYIWVLLAAAVVYSLAAYIAYLKRASESAGKAIAFGVAEPVIKTMIVIPAAFFCGVFFSELSPNANSEGWFLFGLIFGYIILCILMEIIFRMDIRGAFAHKGQFVLNGICTVLIFIVLKNDVLGYNTYVPADSELQSCAVSIEELFPLSQYIYRSNGAGIYVSYNNYRMENMEIQGNPSVMELARKAAKEKIEYTNFDYYDGIEESPEYIETLEKEQSYKYISFGYKLLNGKTIYRQYLIDIDDPDTLKLLSDIFDDYDYKLGSIPILNDGWSTKFDAVRCYSELKSADIKLTESQQSKLLETYQSEYTKLTLDTVMSTIPTGTIEFLCKDEKNYGYSSLYNELYVYPQFTQTIALLKEYGFDMEEWLTAEEVVSIEIIEENNSQEYYNQYVMMEQQEEIKKTTYEDAEQIQQILDSIVYDGFQWQVSAYNDFANHDYTVMIKPVDEGVCEFTYNFINGQIPDFIR